MIRTLHRMRILALLSTLTMGSVSAGGCSLRDIRDAAVAGGLDFISNRITDALSALFPFTDLLGLFTPNFGT